MNDKIMGDLLDELRIQNALKELETDLQASQILHNETLKHLDKLDNIEKELQNHKIGSDMYNKKAERRQKTEEKLQYYDNLVIPDVDTALNNYSRYKEQLRKYRK